MTGLDFGSFRIGFDDRDRRRLHDLWDEVLESGRWTEATLVERFEQTWGAWNGLPAVAFSGWTGAALAAFEFAGVRGQTVLMPSNTFMATPLAAMHAGAHVQFADCNREDLCLSYEDLLRKAESRKPKAVVLVHIGGHIAYDSERIASWCRDNDVFLIEDCAHAHGADWNGGRPGAFGDAGLWSFYATKTISTGEGGMLVSRHPELIEFARKFRNYGKPDFGVNGLGLRMSEFSAAIGMVATERMPEIVAYKNRIAREQLDAVYEARLRLPAGMTSGLYKYIVFEKIERSTGRVYDEPCHRILGHDVDLPNTDWVAANHWCVPLYYAGDREHEEALTA